MSAKPRIDQRVAYVYVAMQNLAEGRPLNEIAEELGISRFAAARMVRRARELGLIEVRAVVDDPVEVDLSARLARRYGLESAIVVATPSTGVADVRAALAAVAARFFVEHAVEDDVVGMTPGRTSVAMSRCVEQLPWLDVVQLTGVGDPNLANGVEAILNIGRMSGGATFPLYAPIFVPDGQKEGILRHPANARTVQRFSAVTAAYLTIGGWPDASLLATQVAEVGEMDRFADRDVVAEIGTVLLDSSGRSISGFEDLIVGIGEDATRAIPLRVAVGGGADKARAVRAVLDSGIAQVVITDAHSASLALDAAAD
ncbi:sugar-binding domain-containing protein [Microbacterium sp. NPDC028030]|uniref:sugar-binding domain-containing protein n=1 Tax=Microbacterium sp. NPDC028030 TaxID=3155124 RepID=UPI00340BA0AC